MNCFRRTLIAWPILLASSMLFASVQQRIIGGVESSIARWPSMAALVVASGGGASLYQRQFCGGNLIGNRWVLSAAHCFFRQDSQSSGWQQTTPDMIRVVLGIDDLTDQADELVITNIITHPDYVPGDASSPNDIALIELANSSSTPVSGIYSGPVSSGVMATVMGWGATSYDPFTFESGDFPTVLREVEIPVVSNTTCAQSYNQGGIDIVSSQICAGEKQGGKDSCGGDSGGPLMTKQNGKYVQAGIVSFGNGCALADFYGVYTRVSSFDSWISDYVGNGISGADFPVDSSDKGDESKGLGAAFFDLLVILLSAGVLRGLSHLRRRRD